MHSQQRKFCTLCIISLFTPNSRREYCWLCVEPLERIDKEGLCCFQQVQLHPCCKYWLQEFTTLIQRQGPLLIWNSLQLGGISCVGLWTLDTNFTKFPAKCFCLHVLCFIPVLGDLTGTGPVPTFLCCLTTISSSVMGLTGYLNFQK